MPSTPDRASPAPTDAQRTFAARVLRELLHRVEVGNANAAARPGPGRYEFAVSHAWTEGATMFLVYAYASPPSSRTWGLVRDTRESLIDPGPWRDADDPARYYYLLDLEGSGPGRFSHRPDDEPDVIWWLGDAFDGLPRRASDVPPVHRYTSPPPDPAWIDHAPPVVNEPWRYADPRTLPTGFTHGRP